MSRAADYGDEAYRAAKAAGATQEQARAAQKAARAEFQQVMASASSEYRTDTLVSENRRLRAERESLLGTLADLMGVSLTAAWQIARMDMPGRVHVPPANLGRLGWDRF